MQERRSMRRFSLNLFGLLCLTEGVPKTPARQVQTTNVSTGGAYLATPDPLPPGTPVHLELFVPRADGVQGTLAGSCICLNAQVVRSETAGMALRFADDYEILNITKLLARNQAARLKSAAPAGPESEHTDTDGARPRASQPSARPLRDGECPIDCAQR